MANIVHVQQGTGDPSFTQSVAPVDFDLPVVADLGMMEDHRGKLVHAFDMLVLAKAGSVEVTKPEADLLLGERMHLGQLTRFFTLARQDNARIIVAPDSRVDHPEKDTSSIHFTICSPPVAYYRNDKQNPPSPSLLKIAALSVALPHHPVAAMPRHSSLPATNVSP